MVDYSSVDSLTSAFRGQDVVVSTMNIRGLLNQKTIIDASIKAGVKRYIPSDFGSFTTDPRAHRDLPGVMGPMAAIQKYLAEKAEAGEIEYTVFSIGAFTEFLVQYPVAFDFANKTAELSDGGRHRLSTTSLAAIGKAIVGALRNPEPTKNRNLRVHELAVSQAQLLALAKKFSPPGAEWKETTVDSEQIFANALRALEEDPHDEGKILGVIKAGLFSGRYSAAYDKVDNELVGLPLLTEADLEAKFAAVYKS